MNFIFNSLFTLIAHQALTLDIDPDLQRNVSKPGYGMNFKYEGQLSHCINRFYVVTKFPHQNKKIIQWYIREYQLIITIVSTCPHVIVQHVVISREVLDMAKYSIYVIR